MHLKPKTALNFLACVAGGISRAHAFVLTGSEAVKASGEAVRGLVKSCVEFYSRPLGNFLVREGIWRFRRRLPARESRQLRRLQITPRVLFPTTIRQILPTARQLKDKDSDFNILIYTQKPSFKLSARLQNANFRNF